VIGKKGNLQAETETDAAVPPMAAQIRQRRRLIWRGGENGLPALAVSAIWSPADTPSNYIRFRTNALLADGSRLHVKDFRIQLSLVAVAPVQARLSRLETQQRSGDFDQNETSGDPSR